MASPLVIIVTILSIVSSSLGQNVGNAPFFNKDAVKETLTNDFYKTTCPNVEKTINDIMTKRSKTKPGIIPGLLRIHFHDCFNTGCDASILLEPERYNNFASEKANRLNGATLRGLEEIDEIKGELEKQCPGVVSCADIIAYAARDAVVLAGNPHYSIPAGRRDGSSVNGELPNELPAGGQAADVLIAEYAAQGLTVDDLVVLEGAHSIGQVLCTATIANELTVINATGSDKNLDRHFQAMLRNKYCQISQVTEFNKINIPLTIGRNESNAWGVSFYQTLLQGKGLIPADLTLGVHPKTKDLVKLYANDSALWAKKFNEGMIKLGKINVITGKQGEIRKHCSYPNNVFL